MSSTLQETLPPPELLSRANFELVVRRIADDIAFGTDDSLFVGSGLEYAHSRPYEPGDPVREIDWKTSARTRVAYVKQRETLKRLPMYLVVDTSASMSVASTELSKHDLGVWIATAMGLVGLRRLSPVCLLSAGSRQNELDSGITPSLNLDHFWRCIEPLRMHRTDEKTELASRLSSLSSSIQRKSLLVVISDLHDPKAVSSLRNLGHQHDVVVFHLQDPSETGSLKAGFFRGTEAETGLGFLGSNRSQWQANAGVARKLAGADISHLLLRTDQAIVPRLREFLLTRATLLRGRQ